jgi:hypothetical protein
MMTAIMLPRPLFRAGLSSTKVLSGNLNADDDLGILKFLQRLNPLILNRYMVKENETRKHT